MEVQPTPANGKSEPVTGFQQRLDSAASGVHAAIDSASGAARPALERYAAEAHGLVDRLADAAAASGDRLETRGEEVSHFGRRLGSEARGYVNSHPLATVAVAVGAGFLLSRILRSL